MNRDKTCEPVPWGSVLLTVIPGALLALSRRQADELGQLLGIAGWLYLGVLAVGLPVLQYRTKRFPVWGLMPLGALAWFGLYLLATGLSSMSGTIGRFLSLEVAIVIVQAVVAAVLLSILLHGRSFPRTAWLLIAIFFAINLLTILRVAQQAGRPAQFEPLQLITVLSGFIEGLMLLAVGLLAVSQHKVLSLLVVLGGYLYMLSDSDYLYGFSLRDWPGLAFYLIAMVVLYAVVTPITFLRARTQMGRAIGLFAPIAAFAGLRLIVPQIVIDRPGIILPGDVLISINLILVLAIGWILYTYLSENQPEIQPGRPDPLPSAG
jgi:hypothetical protein